MTAITNDKAKNDLINEIRLMLGANLVDIELEPDNYDLAIKLALTRYRTRSGIAHEESYCSLQLKTGINNYQLPNEIMDVRQVFRRGVGLTSGAGAAFDPFSASISQAYLLQPFTGQGSPVSGDLFTYELAMGRLDLIGKMFGRDMIFTFHPSTKRLQLMRNVVADEEVLLWCYNIIPDAQIITGQYSNQWIRRYAVAQCKLMMAQARGMFGSLPGPGGGIQMNAGELKTEANEDLEKLEVEIKEYIDHSMPYSFIVG